MLDLLKATRYFRICCWTKAVFPLWQPLHLDFRTRLAAETAHLGLQLRVPLLQVLFVARVWRWPGMRDRMLVEEAGGWKLRIT